MIQFAYFSSDEVPDMLSLEIGAMLQQHPKHPTKPKRTFLWTTGTELLSVITVQGSKTPPGLRLCASTGETSPLSPLSLTPSLCLAEADIYNAFPRAEGFSRLVLRGLTFT